MNKPTKKIKKFLSFLSSKEVERRLEALKKKWGENGSTVIRRAIDLAFQKEFPNG